MKVNIVKGVLWFICGLAATVGAARFIHGLGASTNLNDVTPWGLWIGFDVMGGVALAAGGFVIAGAVYIGRLERYRALARPAVLTAFLGYAAVVVGLLFDLGLPWNIWRATVFWNPHSALFEVAWCVMLYLTVLGLEFSPVVLEKLPWPWANPALRIMKKVTIPLVIAGIVLSTLHQSSLGTLFLIVPFKLHPLWYTPILPFLFLLSAIGLGLMVVTLESSLSSWLYNRKPETVLLGGLGRAAAWVMSGYAVIRIGDILLRGKAAYLCDGSWEGRLFLVEMLISTVAPAVLLSLPAVRRSRGVMTAVAVTAVTGFVLNRLTVGGVAQISATGTRYVPSWTEVTVSLGVVSMFALIFLFFVERLDLWEPDEEARARGEKYARPEPDPVGGGYLAAPWSSPARRWSFIFIVAASLGLALVPESMLAGASPMPTPAKPARWYGNMLLINGDLDEDLVVFDHEGHKAANGGVDSCASCHHMNMPFAEASRCSDCHRSMGTTTDIFDHDFHVQRVGPGNRACGTCHGEATAARGRDTAKPCLECHVKMVEKASTIPFEDRPAPSFADALHGTCVSCHKRRKTEPGIDNPDLDLCGTCHKPSVDRLDPSQPVISEEFETALNDLMERNRITP